MLATTGHAAGFDLEKVARFVEWVPPLDIAGVLAVLDQFHDGCTSRFPFIDPAAPNHRENLWPKKKADTDAEVAHADWFGFRVMTDRRAIATACATPRALKQGLRACFDAWTTLHGEVDFDDLLIVSLLEAIDRSVIVLINEHIHDLRHGTEKATGQRSETVTPFALALTRLLRGHTGARRFSIERLLGYVFPGWKSGQSADSVATPQGFGAAHTNYWERYVSRSAPNDGDKDQDMLSLIVSWRDSRNDSLVRRLVAANYPASLEPFIRIFIGDPSQLLELLSDIVHAELDRSPAQWGDDEPRSVVGLWRVMLKFNFDQTSLTVALNRLLERCVPRNLALAQTLMHFFVTPSNDVGHLLHDHRANERVRSRYQELLVAAFSGKPDALNDRS